MDVKPRVMSRKSLANGRNLGLCNDLVRKTLYIVCQSEKPLTSGDIAQQIRADESRRMSNEYKIIKRLCPPPQTGQIGNPQTRRYFDVVPGVDRQDKYVPNFRGFLLYLYNVHKLMKDTSKDYEKKAEKAYRHLRRRIVTGNIRFNQKLVQKLRNVISNPLIIKIAPFLNYWKDFERYGFDVVGLLIKLGVEVHNQLHIDAEDDTYLLRRVAERYFVELENYFNQYSDMMGLFIIEKYGMESYRSICEIRDNYRRMMTNLLKELINKQLDRLNFLDQECLKSDMLNELDTLAEARGIKIISINQLTRRYNISNYLTAIDIAKNRASLYKKFVVAESFLISKSLIEQVRKLVSDNMRYPDIAVIFEHHNIPKECIYDIMKILGYDEMRGKLANDDDIETGRHIIFVKA